jgi:predicted enzyme related to lactoylglutathione lyase
MKTWSEGRPTMSLQRYPVRATVVVSDIAAVEDFYEGSVGLAPTDRGHEFVRMYSCGDGTFLQVYASPDHAGKATGTVATFMVDDIEAAVAELAARGVQMEQYEAPVHTDPRGIHDAGYVKVAWFRDPEGNTFGLEEAVGT